MQYKGVAMSLTGKSILMVIAPENFRDEEYFEPKAIFEQAGATVITTSTMPVTTSKAGKTVPTDIQLGEIFEADHDAIVLVGGSGADIYLAMVKVHTIATAYADQGKVVAAICIAPSILANAGLLDGKKATCFEDQIVNLEDKGATVLDQPVVQDGLIITADGPKAAREFGETIVRAMGEK